MASTERPGRLAGDAWRLRLGTTQREPTLFDPGGFDRLPLLIAKDSTGTVCRVAVPTTPEGAYRPPAGEKPPFKLTEKDPRWSRPLPWSIWIRSAVGPLSLSTVSGFALVNVALPLGLLHLVAGRRRWSIRLLMALPVAVAVPLTAFLIIEPVLPAVPDRFLSTPRLLFVAATLAGIPVVVSAVFLTRTLIRRRWRALAMLFLGTAVASFGVGAAWLWVDGRAMIALEYYERAEWYLAIVPGAYAVGFLLLLAWWIRGIGRTLRRLAQRHPSIATAR